MEGFHYPSSFTKMHYDLLQRIEHYYKDRKDKRLRVSTNSILAKSCMVYLHVSISELKQMNILARFKLYK